MKTPRLMLAFLAMVAVAAVLAACGGDDAPTDEEYFQRMDEVDKEVDALFDPLCESEDTNARSCADEFAAAATSAEGLYDDVTPSEDAADLHDELVAAIGEFQENAANADVTEEDGEDALFESGALDTTRIDETFCSLQDLADQKGIEADVGCNEVEEGPDPATLPPEETTAVDIQDFVFDPPHIQVTVGDTVTWTQGADPEPHTATSTDDPPVFDTGTLTDEGETGEFTFDEAGVFPYFCEIHPEMLGQVTVVE